jgi:hypothetical protein
VAIVGYRKAYSIVEADSPMELVPRVTEMMGKGFNPQGGPFSSNIAGIIGSQKFYQAMMYVEAVEGSEAVGPGGGPKGLVPSA